MIYDDLNVGINSFARSPEAWLLTSSTDNAGVTNRVASRIEVKEVTTKIKGDHYIS
jgi:hypothetical protein